MGAAMFALSSALTLLIFAALVTAKAEISLLRTLMLNNVPFYLPTEAEVTLPIAPVKDEVLLFSAFSTNASVITGAFLSGTISSWEAVDDVFDESFLQGTSHDRTCVIVTHSALNLLRSGNHHALWKGIGYDCVFCV